MSYVHDIKVLDHGYVRSVEPWGSDESIIEAARMSTDKGFLGWGPRCECNQGVLDSAAPGYCARCGQKLKDGDEKLLRYLWEHKHATPFEMAGAVFEIKAPIFVFREWHRHRTQSFNEMSARYVPLPDENYVPQVARLLTTSTTNKQAAGMGATLDADTARRIQAEIKDAYAAAEATYQHALAAGTPKELARLVLPVGRYSKMRASANLRNWLAFLTLRQDSAAQWEIRQYADAVANILAEEFPRTMALFQENRR